MALLEPGGEVPLSIVKADEKTLLSNSGLRNVSEVSESSVVLSGAIEYSKVDLRLA